MNTKTLAETLTTIETLAETPAKIETLADTLKKFETLAETLAKVETLAETLAKVETLAETRAKIETLAETLAKVKTLTTNTEDLEQIETLAGTETLAETPAKIETQANRVKKIPTTTGEKIERLVLVETLVRKTEPLTKNEPLAIRTNTPAKNLWPTLNPLGKGTWPFERTTMIPMRMTTTTYSRRQPRRPSPGHQRKDKPRV